MFQSRWNLVQWLMGNAKQCHLHIIGVINSKCVTFPSYFPPPLIIVIIIIIIFFFSQYDSLHRRTGDEKSPPLPVAFVAKLCGF